MRSVELSHATKMRSKSQKSNRFQVYGKRTTSTGVRERPRKIPGGGNAARINVTDSIRFLETRLSYLSSLVIGVFIWRIVMGIHESKSTLTSYRRGCHKKNSGSLIITS